jgi:beta-N-acetylhexosaminidase
MRVGEHFLLGFEGLSIPAWIADFEQRFGLGGVILFDRDVVTGSSERNVQSPEQLQSLCAQIHGLPSRPLVFVDQEGGAIRRLRPNVGFADLPAQQQMAELSDHELRETVRASTEQMRRVGIDFNLAPVADLNTNPNNPNIGRIGRSFSADPTVVRRCVHIVNAAATEVGLQLCLKHYPG